MNLEQMLIEGAKEFSVFLDDRQAKELFDYKEILKKWNKKINLTSIEDDTDIIIKHYIDSMSILPFIKDKEIKLIDVGTGAGFPGIPVKIALKNINVTLLDSLNKRIDFLDEVIKLLSLKGIETIHGRAEDYGQKQDYREKFDISVARAVANISVLSEYCLPFVKMEGLFIAMKGRDMDEMETSRKALDVLGGRVEEIKELTLPFSDIKRNIIVIRKFRPTPTKYSRKAGKPSREPLI